MRYYDPTSGIIRLNGIALQELDPVDLRSHIALVPQDTAIFGASVAENIAYGRPDASRDEIVAAANVKSSQTAASAICDYTAVRQCGNASGLA